MSMALDGWVIVWVCRFFDGAYISTGMNDLVLGLGRGSFFTISPRHKQHNVRGQEKRHIALFFPLEGKQREDFFPTCEYSLSSSFFFLFFLFSFWCFFAHHFEVI